MLLQHSREEERERERDSHRTHVRIGMFVRRRNLHTRGMVPEKTYAMLKWLFRHTVRTTFWNTEYAGICWYKSKVLYVWHVFTHYVTCVHASPGRVVQVSREDPKDLSQLFHKDLWRESRRTKGSLHLPQRNQPPPDKVWCAHWEGSELYIYIYICCNYLQFICQMYIYIYIYRYACIYTQLYTYIYICINTCVRFSYIYI